MKTTIFQIGALSWATLAVVGAALDIRPALVGGLFVAAVLTQLIAFGTATPKTTH